MIFALQSYIVLRLLLVETSIDVFDEFAHLISLGPEELVGDAGRRVVVDGVGDAVGDVGDVDGLLEDVVAAVPERHLLPLTSIPPREAPQEVVAIAVHVRRPDDCRLGKRLFDGHLAVIFRSKPVRTILQ